jgi:hypothetical protein
MKTKITTTLMLAALLTGFAATQTTTGPSTNLEATFIDSEPDKLQSGEDGDITFKLVNNGDIEAENVQVQLVDNYPFEVKPDRKTNYSLGTLNPRQEYQISTEVLVAEDAPDGANNFRIRITNGGFSKTVNVPVEVQSKNIDLNLANLQTQPQQLMPDTENNVLTVEVVNNGEKTAENTVLDLQLPDYFERTSSFSSRQALGNLAAGKVKPAEFNFDISEDAPSGLNTIQGSMTYTSGDSSSEVTEDVSFEVNIEGRPQFEIKGVESSLQTGSSRDLRLRLQNTGEDESSSTRIRVLDSSDQPFTYDSSSQYIGTLKPNQTGTAVFNVDTESAASLKDYLIDFEVRGVKGTEVFVEDSTIEASVSDGESNSSSANGVIPVLAALAILGVLGFVFRGRIREKLDSEG